MHHVTRLARAGCLLVFVFASMGFQAPVAPAQTVPEPPPPATPAPDDSDADWAPSVPEGNFSGPPPGCASADLTPPPNTTKKPIPDAIGAIPGAISSTINITTSTTFIWVVQVTTNITHSANGDLSIFLISPHGTSVSLTTGNGASHPNVFSETMWSDGNAAPVTLASFSDNVNQPYLSPEEPLAALIGENPNGQWTLVVHDTQASDIGRLNGWSLEVIGLQQAPIRVRKAVQSNAVQAIPDNGPVISRSLTLANVLAPLGILTVTTVITHPHPGDLLVELISPTGVTLTVSSRNGQAKANMLAGTAWFDAAGQVNPPGAVTDNAASAISGTPESALAPQEGFGELNGILMGGQWTLRVQDKAGGNVGSLGTVLLTGVAFTCAPDLQVGAESQPDYGRLDATAEQLAFVSNEAAAAANVVLTMTVSPQFPFKALSAPGWACLPPAVGSGGNVVCTRASLAPEAQTIISVTVSTPATPRITDFTVTAASLVPDLSPNNNVSIGTETAYAKSANGQPLDVSDLATININPHYLDSGAVEDGGQDAFDGFGALRVVALDGGQNMVGDSILQNFGLVYSAPSLRWHTTAPQSVENIRVSRQLFAPGGANWLRYVDTFTNTGPTTRIVVVGWGGDLGSDNNTFVAGSSSNDLALTAADSWAVTKQDPAGTLASDAPVGYAFRQAGEPSFIGPGLFEGVLVTDTWTAPDLERLSYNFKFSLVPGATVRLAYFLTRGLEEGDVGPQECEFFGGCFTPALGSQVSVVTNEAKALQANPPFCDLSPAERLSLVNWPTVSVHCVYLPVILK